MPSEAVESTLNVSVVVYAGSGSAADVGASLSIITNHCPLLHAMSTVRGLLQKLYARSDTVTSFWPSVGVAEPQYTRSVVRSHWSQPVTDTKLHTVTPSSSTRMDAPGTSV